MNRLKFGHHFFVNDVLKAFNFVNVICIFGLIQSKCQNWAGSSGIVIIDPNGRDFDAFKPVGKLFGCCGGYGKHFICLFIRDSIVTFELNLNFPLLVGA